MIHQITTTEIEDFKTLLLHAFNRVEDQMIDQQGRAKAFNYNYDNTYDQKVMKYLRDMIVKLDRLPLVDDKPVLNLQVTETDIKRYKLWGSTEQFYKSTLDKTISINSNQELEAALQDINKELHLNEN